MTLKVSPTTPANPRIIVGLRHPNSGRVYYESAAHWHETIAPPKDAALCGGGMDATYVLPAGSTHGRIGHPRQSVVYRPD